MKITDRQIKLAWTDAEIEYNRQKSVDHRAVELLQLRTGRLFDKFEYDEVLERVHKSMRQHGVLV